MYFHINVYFASRWTQNPVQSDKWTKCIIYIIRSWDSTSLRAHCRIAWCLLPFRLSRAWYYIWSRLNIYNYCYFRRKPRGSDLTITIATTITIVAGGDVMTCSDRNLLIESGRLFNVLLLVAAHSLTQIPQKCRIFDYPRQISDSDNRSTTGKLIALWLINNAMHT